MSDEVLVRDFEITMLPCLVELFSSYFPPGYRLMSEEYNKWLYIDNPFGKAKSVVVIEGGVWIGFMALVPVTLVSSSERVYSYFVVNVLVHPRHHGKNIFGRMIQAAADFVDAEGSALMGHPNDLAIKSWRRLKMHFHESLRPCVAISKIWSPSIRTRRVTAREQLQESKSVLNEIISSSKTLRVAVTPEYLEWRFLKHPSNTYDLRQLFKGGRSIGVQITKRLRLGVHMLVDQFIDERDVVFATALLPIFTVCLKPDSLLVADRGLIKLPLKKRIPMFLTYYTDPVLDSKVNALGLTASDF